MSATMVVSCTTVRAKARSVVMVSNELANVMLRIADHYSLEDGCMISELDDTLNGMRVWLAAQQLGSMLFEILDSSGRLLRKWELRVDYSESDVDDDQCETRLEDLAEFLASDKLADAASYRVLATFRTDTHIRVPGWEKSKRADDKHLVCREMSAGLITAKHVRVGAVVYSDRPSRPGEAQ